MAFGLNVLTSSGMIDVADMAGSCRYIGYKDISGSSGTVAVPSGYNNAVGTFTPVINNNDSAGRNVSFSVSGSTLSWSGSTSGAAYRVYFFHNKETSAPGSYGLYARNSAGYVIIDGENRVLSPKTYGTSTSSEKPESLYFHRISCNAGDIIMFKLGVGQAGTTSSYNASEGECVVFHSSNSIEYVIVTPNAIPASSGSNGLEVYNSSGSRVFSNTIPIFNAYDSGFYTRAQLTNRTINSGAEYFFSSSGVGVDGGEPFSYFITTCIKRNSATQITLSNIVFNSSPVHLVDIDLSASLPLLAMG